MVTALQRGLLKFRTDTEPQNSQKHTKYLTIRQKSYQIHVSSTYLRLILADRAVFCRKLANLLKLRHYNKKMSQNYQVFLDYASISGFPLGGTHGNPRAFVKIVRYLLPEGVGENITFVHRDCTPGGDPEDLLVNGTRY